MTFISYAQNFEDVVLWRALHDVEKGCYLDVGAQDPVIDSVSLAFYEAGWRGMHVEPVPMSAEYLRKARPDEQVIQAAVADVDGPIKFYELGGLSSGREDVARHHARAGNHAREILVPTVRLEELLESLGNLIHWMKIDVEGMETQVLRSWGQNRTRPWVLVIESTFPNTQDPTHHVWIDEVLARGYKEVHFDGLSRYFLHEEHADLEGRFTAPPNVFDSFQITGTHFASRLLMEQVGKSAAELELRRTEFDAEIAQLREQVNLAAERHEEERQARTSADNHAIQLMSALEAGQLAETEAKSWAEEARLNHIAALEALAAAEREKTGIVDRLWRERQEREATLLEEHETKLRDLISSVEKDLAFWKSRAEQETASAEEFRQQIAELQKQIAGIEKSCSMAERAIGRILATPKSRWQRFGESLGLTSADVTRHILRQWEINSADSSRLDITGSPLEVSVAAASHNASIEMPSLRSLDGMFALPTSEFIDAAYKLVLGRQADPEGRAHYESQLNSGRSKSDVLRQLIRSPEARKRGRSIDLVRRAIRRRELATLPLLGSLFSRDEADLMTQGSIGTSQPAVVAQQTAAFARLDQMEALSHDVAKLKAIVDGLSFAVQGLAKGQARQEEKLVTRGSRREGSGNAASQRKRTNVGSARRNVERLSR